MAWDLLPRSQTVPNKADPAHRVSSGPTATSAVLGIISISMEFYLGLTYLDPARPYGTARPSRSRDVLFF